MEDTLTREERGLLLRLAREALIRGVNGVSLEPLDTEDLPQKFRDQGATFVTLTKKGQLRGCIGTLEAYQPLVEDARDRAVAAALKDYRFPVVESEEIPQIRIEISRLTRPRRLDYEDSGELIKHLRPGIDGVVIKDDNRRATFLPQVWKKIPDPKVFMEQLCIKLGRSANYWREKELEVSVYQVEKFSEDD